MLVKTLILQMEEWNIKYLNLLYLHNSGKGTKVEVYSLGYYKI